MALNKENFPETEEIKSHDLMDIKQFGELLIKKHTYKWSLQVSFLFYTIINGFPLIY